VEDASDHDDEEHDDKEPADSVAMFHSAPTLMFLAILFHDACASPRFQEGTSIFEPSSYLCTLPHMASREVLRSKLALVAC
jgi:hypothetical protein